MDNQIGSGTAKGLLEFLDQLVEKGRASSGGVVPLKSAFKQILSSVDKESWQETDVRTIDIDDYMDRFGVLTNGKYSADSLKTYRSRFLKAISWYKNFLTQPGWAPPKSGPGRKAKTAPTEKETVSAETTAKHDAPVTTIVEPLNSTASSAKEQNDLIAYPFPLRASRIVNLYLPVDLTLAEAKRLGRFLESLSIDENNGQ
jgi:hypothetical protein